MKNKSKFKKYLFKTLHIIGYISTFLVILFSILLGVNSCNNTDNTDKKINNNENQSVLSVLSEDKNINNLYKDSNLYYFDYDDFVNGDLLTLFRQYCISQNYVQGQYYPISYLFGSNYFIGFTYGNSYIWLQSSNQHSGSLLTLTRFLYGNSSIRFLPSNSTDTYVSWSFLNGDVYDYSHFIYERGQGNGTYEITVYPHYSCYVSSPNATMTNLLDNYISEHSSGGGDYTAEDLEEAYQEGYWSGEDVGYQNGYSEGYDVGYYNGFTNANNENFSDFNLLINSQTNFNYLATDQYLTQYLPNVYRLNNLQLNEFRSNYTFHDIEFTYEGSSHVYNSISVVLKQLNQFNFNVSQGELTFLAFTDSNITLNNSLSDYVSYEGCTYFANLLGVDNPSNYYYLDSIEYYYDDPEQTGEIITDVLQVFEGKKYINNLPLYVSDNSVNPSLVISNETRTGLAFVKNGWLNESYRKLYVLSNNNQLLDVQNTALNNYTLVEFLSGAYINPNNGATTTEVNNMFDMFSLAFASALPLLNIQLLPYITLGSLLFVPLIITIILIVIKLLKRG